jgi:hypothetical protein
MSCTPRLFGRSSLVVALVLASALGCGGGKGKTGKTSAALHIMSAPAHASQVGDQMRYQAVLSQPGAADWTMEQGPHNATVNQAGMVTWTPDDTQGGDQAFTVSATMNGHTVSQTFTVTAASAIPQASAHVDPNDPNGGTVSVDAPLSPVQGVAIQIDPGALPPGDPVAVSISSMQHPPTPPAAQVAGVMPQDLEPVEIGPSGLAFKKPVKLQLPIPDKLRTMPALAVQTYDYPSGRWNKVKTVSMDKVAGVIVAEIQHLSTYVVTPDVPVFDLKLGLGGQACAGALVVSAPLAVGFSDVPALSVNGYTGQASTAADVLKAMASGQALQVYIRVKAHAVAANGEQSGWLLASATKQDDGKLTVSVTSDSHAGAFLEVPTTALAATDPELLAWMNGSRADFVFGALGDLTAGAVASAEASLYLVPGADADVPPPASANAIGTADVEATALAAVGSDDDCDGAPNTWDPQPAGAAPPVLVGFPGTPVHLAVGAASPFKIAAGRRHVRLGRERPVGEGGAVDGRRVGDDHAVGARALPRHVDGHAGGRLGRLYVGHHRRPRGRHGDGPAARRRRERERQHRARRRAGDAHRLRQGPAAVRAHLRLGHDGRHDDVGDGGADGRLHGDGARRLPGDVRREQRQRQLGALDGDPHRALGDGQPAAGRAVGVAAQRRAHARRGRARDARALGDGDGSRR